MNVEQIKIYKEILITKDLWKILVIVIKNKVSKINQIKILRIVHFNEKIKVINYEIY